MKNNTKVNLEIDTAFEIISSYVVNLFYNNLYHYAKEEYNNNKSDSITDSYINVIIKFIHSLRSSPTNNGVMSTSDPYLHYKNLVRGMAIHHSLYTKKELGLTEYLLKLTSYIMPDNKFKNLRSVDGEKIIYKVISDSIKDFADIVIKQFISLVIDNRVSEYQEDLLRPMQVNFKEILYQKRKEIFLLFVESTFDYDEDQKIYQYKEQLKKFIESEKKKIKEMEQKIKIHEKFKEKLKEQIILRDNEIKSIKEKNYRLNNKLNELEEKNNDLISENEYLYSSLKKMKQNNKFKNKTEPQKVEEEEQSKYYYEEPQRVGDEEEQKYYNAEPQNINNEEPQRVGDEEVNFDQNEFLIKEDDYNDSKIMEDEEIKDFFS
jgi:hypothetical protein